MDSQSRGDRDARSTFGRPDVTITVLGDVALVQDIMLLGSETDFRGWRLAGVLEPRSDSDLTPISAESCGDSLLFTSQFHRDFASQWGELPVPATYVPIGTAELGSGLFQAFRGNNPDLQRASIDTLSEETVRECYTELNISSDDIEVLPYQGPESRAEYLDFHRSHFKKGVTSIAFTTMRSIERELRAVGIPVIRLWPSKHTLRKAVQTAALLGDGGRYEDSQLALVAVSSLSSRSAEHRGISDYGEQELRLRLHQFLLTQAREIGALVQPSDEGSFLLFTTVGNLKRITDGLRSAPFLAAAAGTLGIPLKVGIGLGETAVDAHRNALNAMDLPAGDGTSSASIVGPDSQRRSLTDDKSAGEPIALSESSRKTFASLHRVVELSGTEIGAPLIIDAEELSELLEVSSHSARRTLRSFLDEGLAWPMPTVPSPHAGRPRRRYRLVTEKLLGSP